MSITAIEIENFKGIGDRVRIELRPITLLFGPNSSGKSTVIQALHYLREIFLAGNVDPHRPVAVGEALDLGGFKKFVHMHELDRSVRIRAELNLEDEEFDGYGLLERDECVFNASVKTAWVEVAISWSYAEERPFVSSYSLGLNGEHAATLEATQALPNASFKDLSLEHPALANLWDWEGYKLRADLMDAERELAADRSLLQEDIGIEQHAELDRREKELKKGRQALNRKRKKLVQLSEAAGELLWLEGEAAAEEFKKVLEEGCDLGDLRVAELLKTLWSHYFSLEKKVLPLLGGDSLEKKLEAELEWSEEVQREWDEDRNEFSYGAPERLEDINDQEGLRSLFSAFQKRFQLFFERVDKGIDDEVASAGEELEGLKRSLVDIQDARQAMDEELSWQQRHLDDSLNRVEQLRRQVEQLESEEESGVGSRGGLSWLLEESFMDTDLLDGVFPTASGALPDLEKIFDLQADYEGQAGDEFLPLSEAELRQERGGGLPEEAAAILAEGNEELRWSEFEGRRRINGVMSQLILGPGKALKKCLEGLRYIGPLRKMPQRDYRPAASGEEQSWAEGMAAWDILHNRGEKFAEQVGSWLGNKGLGCGYTLKLRDLRLIDREDLDGPLELENVSSGKNFFSLEEVERLVLVDERTGLEVQPIEVGVGLSQLLPIVVGAIDHETGGILATEQPELHLHPAIQVELGDFFAACIGRVEGRQFLIETHSEHLILRLCRRIRETSKRGSLGLAGVSRSEARSVGEFLGDPLYEELLSVFQCLKSRQFPPGHKNYQEKTGRGGISFMGSIRDGSLDLAALIPSGRRFEQARRAYDHFRQLEEKYQEHKDAGGDCTKGSEGQDLRTQSQRAVHACIELVLSELGSISLSHQDVSVAFVEQKEGATRFYAIGIDPQGDFLDPWPSGFFGERRPEL